MSHSILITGAAGFIGRELCALLAPERQILGLVRPGGTPPDIAGVRWIAHDLRRPLGEAPLPHRIDAVIHLAQSRRYRDFPSGAADMFGVNVQATFALLEYARQAGATCFILASSGGVYGNRFEKALETDPVNPLDFYLASKYGAELLIAPYGTFFRTVVLRFFFVYGPGQHNMLIPRLIRRVRDRDPVQIEGEPGIRINPVHVRDAVRAFVPALEQDISGLFNIAGDTVLTLDQLVEMIATACGISALVRHVPGRRQGDLVGDNTRMKKILGVKPRIDLREGIEELAGT